MGNNIETAVKKLESCLDKAVLLPLSKFPAPAKSAREIEDQSTKAGKFIATHFGGEKNGNYFAFWKKHISDKNGNVYTKEELLKIEVFRKAICTDKDNMHQYSGEGGQLDRIAKMRAGIKSQKPNPVVFWKHEENISDDDIYILSVAIGGTKQDRQSIVESPCHNYCEEKTGKRFALADYSASNGENGTKQMSLETQIMSYANLKFEDGWKAFNNLEKIKRKALSDFHSNNTDDIDQILTA